MKTKLFLITSFIILHFNSICQSYIDEDYNCELLNWKFDLVDIPTAVDTALKDVECLIIRNQYQKGMKLLDSLIETNSTNNKLYHVKTHFQVEHNIYDTVYLNNLRLALALGKDSDTSLILYNLGVYYLNYLVACNDSSSPVNLDSSDFINLINRAELLVKKSAVLNKEYVPDSYEFLYIAKETKAEVLNIPLQPLSIDGDFDTLLIMSELRDCGEFGGHLEYIKCYYKNGKLKGVFWKDHPTCKTEVDEKSADVFKVKEQKLSKRELMEYLNHVISIDKNPSSWTNAPTSFWVIKDNEPFFIRDWTGNSSEYEIFRDENFKE